MICKKPFEDFICQCAYSDSVITIISQMVPGTELIAVFTDKFRSVYTAVAKANAEGNLEIQKEDLPEGFFNPHAGGFTIKFFADDLLTEQVSIPILARYDSIELWVMGGNTEKSTIGGI